MELSFDDQETFKGAIESLRFNNSDPNTRQQMGSSNSMQLEDSDSEWNKDNNIPGSPTTLQIRRVGSSGSLIVQETRTSGESGDIQVSFIKPSTSPEFTGTSSSANGM